MTPVLVNMDLKDLSNSIGETWDLNVHLCNYLVIKCVKYALMLITMTPFHYTHGQYS